MIDRMPDGHPARREQRHGGQWGDAYRIAGEPEPCSWLSAMLDTIRNRVIGPFLFGLPHPLAPSPFPPEGTRSMDDLIAKLAAATEGSRDLDGEIAVACNLRPAWLLDDPRGLIAGRGCARAGRTGPSFEVPPYTTSLDAALTVVPEGCSDLTIDWNGSNWAAWVDVGNDGTDWQSHPSAALALCIAALKARGPSSPTVA